MKMCSQGIFIPTFNSAVKVLDWKKIEKLYSTKDFSNVSPVARAKLYINSK